MLRYLLLLFCCLFPLAAHASDNRGLRVVAKDPASGQAGEVQLKDDISRVIPAKLIFYAFDACYSGLLTTRGVDRTPRRDLFQSAQKAINGFDLVDYYKGIAANFGVTLYEDSLFIQTRPR